jgi:hypothetical protein
MKLLNGASKSVAIVVMAAVLAACSTSVVTRQMIDTSLNGTLAYGDVDASSASSDVTQADLDYLKTAVAVRVAKLPKGMTPARIQLTVTSFEVVSGTSRFLAGALAGSNKMSTAVKVVSPMGGVIADFDVQRSANPGGYGVFYNQREATIDAVADGLIEVLSGKK